MIGGYPDTDKNYARKVMIANTILITARLFNVFLLSLHFPAMSSDFYSALFLGKESTIAMAFGVFFDTPEVTKIVLPNFMVSH